MSEVQRVVIDGEFTIFTVSEIKARLLDALNGSDQVEVDLFGVSEMDTAGLQIILAAQLDASNRRKQLWFVGSCRAVADVMALYGLAERFAAQAQSAALQVVGAPA
ncbi:MAG TPA: STAS domain-containing protein [Rhodocyclaceae bacterium]|nr:STAS domain-containing protein [Rhodocyclaceae bacterium]